MRTRTVLSLQMVEKDGRIRDLGINEGGGRPDADLRRHCLIVGYTDGMSDGFDVFLSYNDRDKPAVRELARLLEKHGLKVWLDE